MEGTSGKLCKRFSAMSLCARLEADLERGGLSGHVPGPAAPVGIRGRAGLSARPCSSRWWDSRGGKAIVPRSGAWGWGFWTEHRERLEVGLWEAWEWQRVTSVPGGSGGRDSGALLSFSMGSSGPGSVGFSACEAEEQTGGRRGQRGTRESRAALREGRWEEALTQDGGMVSVRELGAGLVGLGHHCLWDTVGRGQAVVGSSASVCKECKKPARTEHSGKKASREGFAREALEVARGRVGLVAV